MLAEGTTLKKFAQRTDHDQLRASLKILTFGQLFLAFSMLAFMIK